MVARLEDAEGQNDSAAGNHRARFGLCKRGRGKRFTPPWVYRGVNSERWWILAILGPALAYAFLAASIALSPWFSWESDALSDLGHSTRSGAAPYFNFGLLIGGFFLVAYGVLDLRRRQLFTAAGLIASALALQSVGVFDEVYGSLHGFVSVAFFLLLWVTMIVYAAEARSLLTIAPIVAYMLVWVLYWADVYRGGIAIPEAASLTVATVWLIYLVTRESLGLWKRKAEERPPSARS